MRLVSWEEVLAQLRAMSNPGAKFQVPSSKFQAPKKSQIPSSNPQRPGYYRLGFGFFWSLELGTWNFRRVVLLFRDAIKVFLPAQEQIFAGSGGRRVEMFVQAISGHFLEFFGLFYDDGGAIAPNEINSAGRAKRRGIDALQLFDALSVNERFAGFLVEAGEGAIVAGEEIELVAIKQR